MIIAHINKKRNKNIIKRGKDVCPMSNKTGMHYINHFTLFSVHLKLKIISTK